MKPLSASDLAGITGPGVAQRPLLGIQYLRAIAALMVALLHMTIQIPEMRSTFETALIGRLNLASGVDIFFVISGFIMMISNRTSTPSHFAIRRIIRIVPLYWILTVLLVLLTLLKPQLFRTTVVTFEYAAKSLLFIPYLNPGHPGEVVPLLPPGWSLNFEMFFYAIFAVVLFAPEKMRVIITGVIFAAALACGWLEPLAPELRFFTNGRLLEFWFGMLIAHYSLRHNLKMPPGTSALLAVGGMVVLVTATLGASLHPEPLQVLARTVLPAAAIILGTLALEERGALPTLPLLHDLGDASYSIYLTHIFTLGGARYVWNYLGLDRRGVVYATGFALFGMVLVVVVAWFTYRLVEKPILKALQRRMRGSRP